MAKGTSLRIFKTIPFVIANTMSIIPFFVFLSVKKNYTNELSLVIPVILYYTFYKTSILIVKGIGNVNNAWKLARISLLAGIIGCCMGILGGFNHLFFDISGILVGICSSIILPTYQTVYYHQRKYNNSDLNMTDYLIGIIFVALMIGCIGLTLSRLLWLSFLALALFLFLAYVSLDKLPHFPPKTNEHIFKINTFSKQDLALSIILVTMVFAFRFARQIGNADVFLIACVAFTILLLFVVLWKNKSSRKIDLPEWFIVTNIFNGMCSAFIFIYSLFYVVASPESNSLNWIYASFAIGLLLAQFTRRYIYQSIRALSPFSISIIGMSVGVILILPGITYIVGIGILSFFISANSILLNHSIYHFELIPQDERLMTKYRNTTLGNIIQQGILLATIWTITELNHSSINQLLLDYRYKTLDLHMTDTLFLTRGICIAILLALSIYIILITWNKGIQEQSL